MKNFMLRLLAGLMLFSSVSFATFLGDPTGIQTGGTALFTVPAAGQMLVGNAGGTAYALVLMSGDATMAASGAVTIANSAITNAKVSATAAIAYSKLNLSASIVNADIASGAAIAFSKLASLTSAHFLVGNGSNVATDVAMSGDATLANTGAITLATVNSNVGSFTSANITVNGKGLVTAAANGSGGGSGSAATAFNSQSGSSYTLVLSDAWSNGNFPMVEMTSSSANTVTVPQHSSVAFVNPGDHVQITQNGTGVTSVVAGSGVTFANCVNPVMSKQYGIIEIFQTALNNWFVHGDFGCDSVSGIVVGGGGGSGGGSHSGGGGAGAIPVSFSNQPVSITAYTITVGAGGTAGIFGNGGTAGTGGTSSFDVLASGTGGVGGGNGSALSGSSVGANGGATSPGGGGGSDTGLTGGTGVFAGGNGSNSPSNISGGGGGCSAIGGNAYGTGTCTRGGSGSVGCGGDGGAGCSETVNGISLGTYGGGGGGGSSGGSGNRGAGGNGGGGDGSGGGACTAGSANTGGGGGGQAQNSVNGCAGGSGQVILTAPIGVITATGGTHTTSGSFDVWTFNSSGTWTVTGIQ